MTNPYERIQQYLDGDLKGEELQTFESQLKVDETLSEELALVQAVRTAVDFGQKVKGKEERLQETLTEAGATYFEEESDDSGDGKVRPIRRVLAVAASVLLLVGVGSWWYANRTFSDRALIEELYEPLLDYKKAGNVKDEVLLKKSKDAFFSQQYLIAISNLEEISQSTGMTYYEAQGLLAYSFFNNQNFNRAIEQFTLLIEDHYEQLPIEFKDENRLRWSRLLAYVGSENTSDPFFERELAYFLNHNSQIYQEKARKLEVKLNSYFRKILLN